jgi:hypothetical protein
MMIPGSNLLMTALSVIGSQTVNWFQYQSIGAGPTGLETVTYAAHQTIMLGSVQPVPRNRYEAWGLDWQKSYVTWFVPNVNAQSISRSPDNSGDVIEWPVNKDGSLVTGKSRRYQLIGDTPWTNIDGWTYVIGIDIGPATGATTNV